MRNFIKVGTHRNFEAKSAQFWVKILNFQISYLRLANLTCPESHISWYWEYISFLGPNFPGMRGLILVLMSNVGYLAVILIFFGGYLVVTALYLMVTTCYCSLLMVTARHRSLLLVPTFSINDIRLHQKTFTFARETK